MPKGVSVHEMQLEPTVDRAAFERHIVEEFAPALREIGGTARLLKGLRGDREGKYLLLMEYDDVGAFERYWPDQKPSAEFEQWRKAHAAMMDKLFTAYYSRALFTDYSEVGT